MTMSDGCSELTALCVRSYNSGCGVCNDKEFANAVILYKKVHLVNFVFTYTEKYIIFLLNFCSSDSIIF